MTTEIRESKVSYVEFYKNLELIKEDTSSVINSAIDAIAKRKAEGTHPTTTYGSQEYDSRIAKVVQAVFNPDTKLQSTSHKAGYQKEEEWLFAGRELVNVLRERGAPLQ